MRHDASTSQSKKYPLQQLNLYHFYKGVIYKEHCDSYLVVNFNENLMKITWFEHGVFLIKAKTNESILGNYLFEGCSEKLWKRPILESYSCKNKDCILHSRCQLVNHNDHNVVTKTQITTCVSFQNNLHPYFSIYAVEE